MMPILRSSCFSPGSCWPQPAVSACLLALRHGGYSVRVKGPESRSPPVQTSCLGQFLPQEGRAPGSRKRGHHYSKQRGLAALPLLPAGTLPNSPLLHKIFPVPAGRCDLSLLLSIPPSSTTCLRIVTSYSMSSIFWSQALQRVGPF